MEAARLESPRPSAATGATAGPRRRLSVVFLCHRIPYPPDKGDKIRSYHLLAHLARHHDVDLVTHADDPRDLAHRQILGEMCRSVQVFPLNPWVGRLRAAAALAGGRPLSVAYMTRGAARRAVRRLLEERRPDVIVGYSGAVAAYVPRGCRAPFVLDLVDVDSEKWAAYAALRGPIGGLLDRLEARRLRAFERRAGRRAARIVVTTAQEAQVYRESVLARAVDHVTNGAPFPDAAPPEALRDPDLAIFVGTMDYRPNVMAAVLAAREVLPLVRRARPGAKLRIIGRSPAPEVRALAGLPGVEVTGEVPDTRPHLERAAIALVPLRIARGVQTKVLESLAYGIPLVATPNVLACLEPGAEEAVLVGEGPAELAAEAVRLLADPAARERAGTAARAYVRARHDWRAVDAFWDGLLDDVAAAGREGRAG